MPWHLCLKSLLGGFVDQNVDSVDGGTVAQMDSGDSVVAVDG